LQILIVISITLRSFCRFVPGGLNPWESADMAGLRWSKPVVKVILRREGAMVGGKQLL